VCLLIDFSARGHPSSRVLEGSAISSFSPLRLKASRSGQPEIDGEVAARLSAALTPLLLPGALVISDQPLSHADWLPVPLPESVAEGRYYIFETLA